MTTQRLRKSSTSAKAAVFSENEVVETLADPRKISWSMLGSLVALEGRDITVGQHDGKPLLYVGILESFRVNKTRIVTVLSVRLHPRNSPVRTPRVIEIRLVPGGTA